MQLSLEHDGHAATSTVKLSAKLKLRCTKCGREFERYRSAIRGTTHFCSFTCRKGGITLNCAACGKAFQSKFHHKRYKERKARGEKFYCTHECWRTRNAVSDTHKRCTHCGENKPTTEFFAHAHGLMGLYAHCKACHRQKAKPYRLRRLYGISVAEAEALLAEGSCAICGRPDGVKDGRRLLHIDHDHKTGKVRDVLCYGCNGGLGLFEDDPARLRAAADYLEKHA